MKINTEDINCFEKDGVISLGRILADEEVTKCRAELEKLFFLQGGAVSQHVRDLSEVHGKPLSYAVMQLVNAYKLSEMFERLVFRKDIVETVKTILGSEIRLFRDQAFYKTACSESEIFMHQDNRYWHLEPAAAVTVWIALDHATIENGCVHFIKGSHHLGRVEHSHARAGQSILLEAKVSKENATPIEVPAGFATIHHCQTLHFSPPNRSKQARRAYSIQYMAANVTCRGESTENFSVVGNNYH